MSDSSIPSPAADAPAVACMPGTEHIHHVAAACPGKTAMLFVPGGRSVSYGELERAANQTAHAMRAAGLQPGDAVAVCLPNSPELMYAVAGAQRIGVYFILLPFGGSPKDLAYIVRDSGARFVVAGSGIPALAGLRALMADGQPVPVYVQHTQSASPPTSPASGADGQPECSWDALLRLQPDTLPDDPRPGREMMYSSGSTGRPKGVRKPMFKGSWDAPDPRNVALTRTLGLRPESVFLSTSPLYHSAPHRYLLAALGRGLTCIVMERFDAERALQCIEQYACTHSLWVPTMFQRMLRLDAATRARYATHAMVHASHGAAPCAVHVKEAMIAWWGPVFYEYYSGTEGVGTTWIDSHDWLAHKGSVGRPEQCTIHVLDEHGTEVPVGETGTIYFESQGEFSYWNDPQKTRAAISAQGWRTFGDIGYVDAQGYLYLTDRRDFMLISGGVNIYPQEVEDALLEHPAIADVAAFGVPDDDLGERLVAVVQLEPAFAPSLALESELQAYCRDRMGKIKAPKQIIFVATLPRLETGKLHKKRLRERLLRGDLSPAAPALS